MKSLICALLYSSLRSSRPLRGKTPYTLYHIVNMIQWEGWPYVRHLAQPQARCLLLLFEVAHERYTAYCPKLKDLRSCQSLAVERYWLIGSIDRLFDGLLDENVNVVHKVQRAKRQKSTRLSAKVAKTTFTHFAPHMLARTHTETTGQPQVPLPWSCFFETLHRLKTTGCPLQSRLYQWSIRSHLDVDSVKAGPSLC